jgi:ATP-dependent helicase/nuclease subunit A
MTRAEDRLIVCGYHGKRAPNRHLAFDRQPRTGRRTRKRGSAAPRHRRTVHRFQVTKLPPMAPAAAEERGRCNSSRHCRRPVPPLPPFEDLPRPLSPSGASALIDEEKQAVVDTRSPVLDAEVEPGLP